MSKTTHIIAILDRSGSMAMMANEVIGNFNGFLKEQQSVEGKAKLTLVLFDDQYEVVYDKVDLQAAKPITAETYFTRGMTAMNDAVGKTLSRMRDKKNAIVLINTDGYENASKEYDQKAVKALVDQLKDKWEFIFVGADIDAAQIGGSLGIANTMQVKNDAVGVARAYDTMNFAATSYRSGTPVDMLLNNDTSAVDVKVK